MYIVLIFINLHLLKKQITLKLFSIYGELIFTKEINSFDIQVDLPKLNQNLLIYTIEKRFKIESGMSTQIKLY